MPERAGAGVSTEDTATNSSKPRRAKGRLRGFLAGAGSAALAVVLLLPGLPVPFAALLLSPLVAVLVSTTAVLPTDAAAAGVIGLLGGALLARTFAPTSTELTVGALNMTLAMTAAGTLAYVARACRARTHDHARLLAYSGCVAAVALLWVGTMVAVTQPVQPTQPSIAETLSVAPPIDEKMSDEGLYATYVQGMRAGLPYYPLVRGVLEQSNPPGTDKWVAIGSPLSYRPPLVYWLLAQLPQSGLAYVGAFLLVGTAATVAGATLAGRLAGEQAALLAAVGLSSLFGGYGRRIWLLQTEPWAGALLVVSIALAAAALTGDSRRRLPMMIGAAAVAAVAALTRELALAFIPVAILATLLDPDSRRHRLWLPWVGALVLALAALGVHWSFAAVAGAGARATVSGTTWWSPDGSGLHAAAFMLARGLGYAWPVGWVLIVAGVTGAITARRFTAHEIMLAGVAAGGVLVLALAHPPGDTWSGIVPAYWAGIVYPSIFVGLSVGVVKLGRAGMAPENDSASATLPTSANAV